MLKKFFSLTSEYNIFMVISLILLLIGLFYKVFYAGILGLYIGMMPRVYTSFIQYKSTRKLTFYFTVDAFCFVIFTVLFAYDSISYLGYILSI